MLSSANSFLEEAFDLLNNVYFDSALPHPVITIQSSQRTYGHFTPAEIWEDEQKSYHEINISAESLNRSLDQVVATLQHENIHLYCHVKGIKETSRGGSYHNKNFKREAEARGLLIERHPVYGFTLTEPSTSLVALIESHFKSESIDLHRVTLPKVVKPSSSRKYQCPICMISVRATSEVRIKCVDCNVPMQLVERSGWNKAVILG